MLVWFKRSNWRLNRSDRRLIIKLYRFLEALQELYKFQRNWCFGCSSTATKMSPSPLHLLHVLSTPDTVGLWTFICHCLWPSNDEPRRDVMPTPLSPTRKQLLLMTISPGEKYQISATFPCRSCYRPSTCTIAGTSFSAGTWRQRQLVPTWFRCSFWVNVMESKNLFLTYFS